MYKGLFEEPFLDIDGICPPMPDPIEEPSEFDRFKQAADILEKFKDFKDPRIQGGLRQLRDGCYIIHITSPLFRGLSIHYFGTLRVERRSTRLFFSSITVSGDLYFHSIGLGNLNNSGPNPANGIPIFSINNYTYYLEVKKVPYDLVLGGGITIEFILHRYNHATNTWSDLGLYTANLSWSTAPSEYPSSDDFLSGVVKRPNGSDWGTITLGWVSENLRKAVIEIDKVAASEWPLDNGDGRGWEEILQECGWEITVQQSDSNVTELNTAGTWTDADCHAEMLDWRDNANLDNEWRYHLLCVRTLTSTDRGRMYDAGSTDSNNIPREGAAIASHWNYDNTPLWGVCAGQRFGTTVGYFRTAIHEIGHAMILIHLNGANDNSIMQVTPEIADNATAANPFPNNIQWFFNNTDKKYLAHLPDIVVRPGGVPFGVDPKNYPRSPTTLWVNNLNLYVRVVKEVIPLGAPVRIEIELENNSDEEMKVPCSLSLKQGYVSGAVIDPSGKIRTYRPLVLDLDVNELEILPPRGKKSHSLTLLRGRQGALFPTPGFYKIQTMVVWNFKGLNVGTRGETNIIVTPPVDEEHAKAALHILKTPDTLLTLVLGGDHLKDGIKAIHTGLENPILRPHYAYIEAKRLGNSFKKRKADIEKAVKLIDKDTIMSVSEIRRVAAMVKSAERKLKDRNRVANILKYKISKIKIDETTKKLIESIK